MAEWGQAWGYVLGWEGALSDDPGDPGGLTHYGVTLPVLREMGEEGDLDGDGDIDLDDIRALNPANAIKVFEAIFWRRLGLAALIVQEIATKVADTAVNLGRYQAGLIAQRGVNGALCALGLTIELKVDGWVGPKTRAVLNDLGVSPSLRAALAAEQAGVYRAILARRPQTQRFAAGWMRRAYSWPGRVLERAF